MTDCSTTPRRKLSTRERLKVFEDAKGICAECERKIRAGDRWIVEHKRALGLGGEESEKNRKLFCGWCADEKTHGPEGDISNIAQAKRRKAKHVGAKAKKPWNPKWRKPMRGPPVLREPPLDPEYDALPYGGPLQTKEIIE